jgi:hypothetical protein
MRRSSCGCHDGLTRRPHRGGHALRTPPCSGSGSDRITGGKDDDTIAARDGRRDRISCGSGKRDRVTADRGDAVAGDCDCDCDCDCERVIAAVSRAVVPAATRSSGFEDAMGTVHTLLLPSASAVEAERLRLHL